MDDFRDYQHHTGSDTGPAERHLKSCEIRETAALIAASRAPQISPTNGEDARHAELWPLAFTKGLPHDSDGFVDPRAYRAFVRAITQPGRAGLAHDFDVPLGPQAAGVRGGHTPAWYRPKPDYREPWRCTRRDGNPIEPRDWDGPRAGHLFDLQGADPGDIATGAAPTLGSAELIAEMAELYALALLRDVPFSEITAGSDRVLACGLSVDALTQALGSLPFLNLGVTPCGIGPRATERRATRFDQQGQHAIRPLFQGATRNDDRGPALSQFLLVGTGRTPTEQRRGRVSLGVQDIDQRVGRYPHGVDHMVDTQSWLDAQQGANLGHLQALAPERGFITTPRHLAACARLDQISQHCTTAALILLGQGAPRSGAQAQGTRGEVAALDLLSSLAIAASHAAKAARRQAFHIHRRGRPERLAAMLDKVANGRPGRLTQDMQRQLRLMLDGLERTGLLAPVAAHNAAQLAAHKDPQNGYPLTGLSHDGAQSLLMPMVWIDGSPMTPSHGAAPATVAGACVTMLKARFEMFTCEDGWTERPMDSIGLGDALQPCVISGLDGIDPARSGADLVLAPGSKHLTIQGELDKLAGNLAQAGCMAGVHFFSDASEGLRLGERIALTILQEQMLTSADPVSLRFTSFDGDRILIEGSGHAVGVTICGRDGRMVDVTSWLSRAAEDHMPV
ncbi:hypothetical protein KO516_02305 [Citreicella sp. C3M06]|uniref:hypothetical protein n=1 Tax=Citreicella sp. C3M06 TaxID=2841564 RepID=UPI001C081D59|nr:hypothetical protein [Citreicella sp. C3M06]MBU2959672.1 hypothetical protein [Citreicella sp. C3M06]